MWLTAEHISFHENELFYFKKTFPVTQNDPSLTVQVCAETRYKLYINDRLVGFGPCKPSYDTHYYDTYDVSDYLCQGENVIFVKVLKLTNLISHPSYRLSGILRTGKVAFLLCGTLKDGKQKADIGTGSDGWMIAKETEISFPGDETQVFNGQVYKQHNDLCWQPAPVLCKSMIESNGVSLWGETNLFRLKPRPIPYMRLKERILAENITVSKNTEQSFVLDAGEYVTAYLCLDVLQGKNARIAMIPAECYVHFDKNGNQYKAIRDDASGEIVGDEDVIYCDGSPISYEPLWFRAFRFLKVTVSAKEEEVVIKAVKITQTNYPMQIEGSFSSDGKQHMEMWDISLRTLKSCMHETYEDCPYYEQLQYQMDTRLQMLFCYQFMLDDRLTKKALNDFCSSKTSEGIMFSRSPAIWEQFIPQFSLHFIFMLQDHLLYRGNEKLVEHYLPTAQDTLNWFHDHLNAQNLVDKTPYWQYVDWVDGWERGVPSAIKHGPITIVSLIYAYALQSMARICKLLGKSNRAYLSEAKIVLQAVETHCYNAKRGLYRDGPSCELYSTHVQLWAVLVGLKHGKQALKTAFKENLPMPSYSMSFYLFRAFEKANLYNMADKYLDKWRIMIDKHCSTWVEDDVRERSECHGWGSVPIYEFCAMYLGVQPTDIGFSAVRIKPYTKDLSYANGSVCTPYGMIEVQWKKENGEFVLNVQSPVEIEKTVILPNKETYVFCDKSKTLRCQL